jgi:glutamine synthetase
MSIFLGDQLEDVMAQLEKGPAKSSRQGGLLGLGSPVLPNLPRHAGDRNRTSPFAFTGNKFEFRAVGSSQSVSFPNIALNTIVAESLDEMAGQLEAKLKGQKKTRKIFEAAVAEVLSAAIHEAKPVIFGGDNYTDAWHGEAKRRKLLNMPTTMDALVGFLSEKNLKLFADAGVLSKVELASREDIWVDQYFKTINIEAETTEALARTMILPASVRYLNDLQVSAAASKGIAATASDVAERIDHLVDAIEALRVQNVELGGDTVHEKAHHVWKNVLPAMAAVRKAGDSLERVVSHDYWPLPTYREILWVK